MKRIFILLWSVLGIFMFAQNNFEYQRTWGTYFGPSATVLTGAHYPKGILFDSQKNMYFDGGVLVNGQPNTYYNQFVIGGGGNFLSNNTYEFDVRFNSMGVPDYFGYRSSVNPVGIYNRILAIDAMDNQYKIQIATNPTIQPTAGTFLPADPQPSSSLKVILSKYSSSGALVWATYLPSSTTPPAISIDDGGNVFVSGSTTLMQNLSTTGVWQENYDELYDSNGDLILNGYLLKLNNSGQRIWATYLPSNGELMRYHNGSVYMVLGSNTNPNLTTMATAGAFQTSPASHALAKINANTGVRQWGTYYGYAPNAYELGQITDMEINASGIYLTGTDYNYQNSNYYGTTGSYRPQVSGGSDIFLSKFSHSGSREWSTYFGHSGSDQNEVDKSLVLNGTDVYVAASANGIGSNIATAGAYQTAPEQSLNNGVNFYFAKFNSAGNLIWCSYYGGTAVHSGHMNAINIGFDNGVLFLFGATNSNNWFTTEGAWMPQRNPSNTPFMTAFIARFDNKNQMATSETALTKDLVLYNNPNNGNFSLKGSVLQKESCEMSIYDASGKMVFTQKLSKNSVQQFNLQHLLSNGNYLVEVRGNTKQKLKVFKMIVRE